MICYATAILCKEVVSALQGIDKAIEGRNVDIGHLAQLRYIVTKLFFLNVHGLVGTPSGQHPYVAPLAFQLSMMFKTVDRIVDGANARYAKTA